MKASEYEMLLAKAIENSIEKRWALLAENPDAVVEKCHLCSLANKVYNTQICLGCNCCPLYNAEMHHCCDGWSKWLNAYYYQNKKKKIEAAKQIIAELKAIDVKAWTSHLVEIKLLEEG